MNHQNRCVALALIAATHEYVNEGSPDVGPLKAYLGRKTDLLLAHHPGVCICPKTHEGHSLYWTQTEVTIAWFIEGEDVLFHKSPDVVTNPGREYVYCATCDEEVPELTVHDQVLAFK